MRLPLELLALIASSSLVSAQKLVAPSPRWGSASLYLEDQRVLVVIGGRTPATGGYTLNSGPLTDDILCLDLSNPFDTNNPAWYSYDQHFPTPISGATLSKAGDEILLFGGESGTEPTQTGNNSAWIATLDSSLSFSWTQQTINQPMRRVFHSAVTCDNQVFIFGGRKDDGSMEAFQELWMYLAGVWTILEAPEARYGHAAVASLDGTSFIVLGGIVSTALGATPTLATFETILVFIVSTQSWTTIEITGDLPPPRHGHIAVMLVTGQIMIHGGAADVEATVVLDDMWVLDAEQMTWTQVPITAGVSPSARFAHDALAMGGSLLLSFGYGADTAADSEVHIYDAPAGSWQTVYTPPAPLPGSSGGITPSISGGPRPTRPPTQALPTGSGISVIDTVISGVTRQIGVSVGVSTQPNGEIITQTATFPLPTPLPSSSDEATAQNSHSSNLKKTLIASIVPTFFILCGLALVLSYYYRRRKRLGYYGVKRSRERTLLASDGDDPWIYGAANEKDPLDDEPLNYTRAQTHRGILDDASSYRNASSWSLPAARRDSIRGGMRIWEGAFSPMVNNPASFMSGALAPWTHQGSQPVPTEDEDESHSNSLHTINSRSGRESSTDPSDDSHGRVMTAKVVKLNGTFASDNLQRSSASFWSKLPTMPTTLERSLSSTSPIRDPIPMPAFTPPQQSNLSHEHNPFDDVAAAEDTGSIVIHDGDASLKSRNSVSSSILERRLSQYDVVQRQSSIISTAPTLSSEAASDEVMATLNAMDSQPEPTIPEEEEESNSADTSLQSISTQQPQPSTAATTPATGVKAMVAKFESVTRHERARSRTTGSQTERGLALKPTLFVANPDA